jgi:hypothetical protein
LPLAACRAAPSSRAVRYAGNPLFRLPIFRKQPIAKAPRDDRQSKSTRELDGRPTDHERHNEPFHIAHKWASRLDVKPPLVITTYPDSSMTLLSVTLNAS